MVGLHRLRRAKLFLSRKGSWPFDGQMTWNNTPLCATCRQLLLEIDNFFHLHQEPAVDLCQVQDLVDAETGAKGVAEKEDALGVGHAELAGDDFAREHVAVAVKFGADAPGFAVPAQAAAADLE